ncbi:hypothetical protein, partial [Parageobacillus toebii]|uniref:hypothetical protein n=1 Tax=Parageobacillus toebii TaxID=153151 RepID=UPI001C850DF8
ESCFFLITVYDFQGGGFFMCIYAFVMRFATRSLKNKRFWIHKSQIIVYNIDVSLFSGIPAAAFYSSKRRRTTGNIL